MPVTATTWLSVEPDRYLDCRRADWQVHEAAGQVRYERALGDRRASVLVDEGCLELLEVLTR